MSLLRKTPDSAIENYIFRGLFRDQLTDKPKRFMQVREEKNRSHKLGWLFVSNDCRSDKACRTYQTLFLLSSNYTYYTPNTFYRNDSREEANLRWLNALVLDVDVKNGHNDGLTFPDLLERIRKSGLPEPSIVVQTPSGGFHVYFVLDKPRRAYSNAIAQYKKLQVAMSEAIGGDRQAVGAGRFFRMPTAQNTIYRTDRRVSFDELNDWYWLNQDQINESNRVSLRARQNLLSQPAVQKLLEGAEVGKRDNTAYTLALVFKAEGYDQDAAENELQAWNSRLESPLSKITIRQKVQSAYKPGAPIRPTAGWIEYLSGQRFSYSVWEPAKPRSERKTSHYHEWAGDILDTLCSHPEGEVSGSQRELAASWGMSLSTFQQVTKILLELGKISVEVVGKGRGARTIIRMVKDSNVELLRPLRPGKSLKKNVPDSKTFNFDGVVGGTRLSEQAPLSRPPDGS
ncbi:hypothetical protein BK138_34440 [Paenibacillus rhizosphaerae]|uniref:Primase C-terminal 1 domain-containing protein n=1 Tax=Paenibacillus rhizosphaerae TaxID=297318 RepID=A0A1R1DZ28_9BACL|nr:primase C-terminal domain-containing protein [Paenibacillus rhizosphaerae]OMF44742.1 hypothetical protein BK138_34440 [Paenibacillus rhizosphaerae]